MTEVGNLAAIADHGLLSTTAVLDLFNVTGEERSAIEAARRASTVIVQDEQYGTVEIRDNGPLSEKKLAACLLDELSPSDWYRILNRHVFFWLHPKRVARLVRARAYRDRAHAVLTVDVAQLVARYGHRVALSPINSGSTVYAPQPRGLTTFQTIDAYDFGAWRQKRGASNAIAELAVEYAVTPVKDVITRVEIWHPDGTIVPVSQARFH